ncbi:MAG: 3-dehydroquinate synthase [Bacteroidetes bacterium]|nr:3-dehydroquinate synthase [Bacteroidota bacterium]
MNAIIYSQTELIALLQEHEEVYILVDENTERFCYPLIQNYLPPHRLIRIRSGEVNKNMQTTTLVLEQLMLNQASRKVLLVNLGGGVISDLGGFAASIYKRGIQFINIPTTLLAMVDAAIGGKTGIDFHSYKNILGSFSLPKCVYINAEFLKTLDDRQIRSGLAEMLKHGLIADAHLWSSLLDRHSRNDIASSLKESIQVKLDIVDKDPFEKNIRKKLNFGHTIGHAIESIYMSELHPLSHGEAIAIGMLLEAKLSTYYAGLSIDEYIAIENGLHKIYSDVIDTPFDPKMLMKYMWNDKKNQDGKISFSLLNAIGSCQIEVLLTAEQIGKLWT